MHHRNCSLYNRPCRPETIDIEKGLSSYSCPPFSDVSSKFILPKRKSRTSTKSRVTNRYSEFVITGCYEQVTGGAIFRFSSVSGRPSNRHLFIVHRQNRKFLLFPTFSVRQRICQPCRNSMKSRKSAEIRSALRRPFPPLFTEILVSRSLNRTSDIPAMAYVPIKTALKRVFRLRAYPVPKPPGTRTIGMCPCRHVFLCE